MADHATDDVTATGPSPARPGRRSARALAGIAVAGVLVVPLMTAPAAEAQGPSATLAGTIAAKYPTIRYGSTGPAVERLQRMLHVRPVSGWFGPVTRKAVRAFEKRHGLVVNGIVGLPTWRVVLRVHVTRYPTLRYDSSGAAVERLQRMLKVRPVSGWFGPVTRSTVIRFQKRHHLAGTGVVGWRTWRAVERAHQAASRPSRSSSRPAPAPGSGSRVCPVPGAVFSDTYGAARGGHGHAGVDMLARLGSKIRAVESGTVVRAHWSGSIGGYTITLQGRSGSKFFMAHNSKNLVRAGQQVRAGQVIALVGSTGNAGSVNHLHFEYWKSGRESDPVNPTPLITSLCR